MAQVVSGRMPNSVAARRAMAKGKCLALDADIISKPADSSSDCMEINTTPAAPRSTQSPSLMGGMLITPNGLLLQPAQ
eukprot:961433-Rhodomonas_salina.3